MMPKKRQRKQRTKSPKGTESPKKNMLRRQRTKSPKRTESPKKKKRRKMMNDHEQWGLRDAHERQVLKEAATEVSPHSDWV